MTFQNSTFPDGWKKKEMYSESIRHPRESAVSSVQLWVKKMLSPLGTLDSVSLTWLSFSTPRPTRFIHLSWLNHTKDRVGAVRRALIWHFPHYPAGRFLWGFFFFFCTCLVQSIYTFMIISPESVATSHNSQLWSIQQRSGVWGITEEPFKTRVEGR